jgi:hypothetical protein
MRNIKVALHNDESVVVKPGTVYMGEHHAVRLEVTLPKRLREDFDFYTLTFDPMDQGNRVPIGNIYQGDEGMAYHQNGVIYCTLPAKLTNCSFLRAQVEAHRQSNGECTAIEKSASFTVAFEHGIVGEGDTLQSFALGHITQLMAQIDAAQHLLNTVGEIPGLDCELVEQLRNLVRQIAQAELSTISQELSQWATEKLQEMLDQLQAQTVDADMLQTLKELVAQITQDEVNTFIEGFAEDLSEWADQNFNSMRTQLMEQVDQALADMPKGPVALPCGSMSMRLLAEGTDFIFTAVEDLTGGTSRGCEVTFTFAQHIQINPLDEFIFAAPRWGQWTMMPCELLFGRNRAFATLRITPEEHMRLRPGAIGQHTESSAWLLEHTSFSFVVTWTGNSMRFRVLRNPELPDQSRDYTTNFLLSMLWPRTVTHISVQS